MTYPKWVPRGDGQQILCHSEEEEAQASVETAPEKGDLPTEATPVRGSELVNRGGRPRKVQ